MERASRGLVVGHRRALIAALFLLALAGCVSTVIFGSKNTVEGGAGNAQDPVIDLRGAPSAEITVEGEVQDGE